MSHAIAKTKTFKTIWCLVQNSWICTKDAEDYTKLKWKASKIEKRTRVYKGNTLVKSIDTSIPLPKTRKRK